MRDNLPRRTAIMEEALAGLKIERVTVSEFPGAVEFALRDIPDAFRQAYYYIYHGCELDNGAKDFMTNIITTMMNQIDDVPGSRDTLSPEAREIIGKEISVPYDDVEMPDDPKALFNDFKDLLMFERTDIVISLGFIILWMSNGRLDRQIDLVPNMYDDKYIKGLRYMLRPFYNVTSHKTQPMISMMFKWLDSNAPVPGNV